MLQPPWSVAFNAMKDWLLCNLGLKCIEGLVALQPPKTLFWGQRKIDNTAAHN
jgi:hypothetical protein